MNMQEAFAPQLAEGIRIGEEWRTRTLQDVYDTIKVQDPNVSYAHCQIILERNQKHIGEKTVYFIGVSHEKGIEIYRAWESEIDSLSEKWTPAPRVFDEGSKLPRLYKNGDQEWINSRS